MALVKLETKWKAALTSILEELTEPEFRKLLFVLDKIPQGLKADKHRQDLPNLIVQYYGTEESIAVVDREMKRIPRKDAAVQQLLRPFVEKLKTVKKPVRKPAADPGSLGKKQTPAADPGSLGKKQTPAADPGSVGKKQTPAAAPGSVGKKQTPAADPGSVGKKQTPAPGQAKICRAVKAVPAAVVKPDLTREPTGSKTYTVSAETKCRSVFAQVQSAVLETGRMKIIGVKSSNKTNTHLVVEFNGQMRLVFATTRLLADKYIFSAEDAARFFRETQPTVEATIQGNKITEIKRM